ncbi:MAG: hypothetical protein FJX20_03750 [Alphaproteobacteria bacterium]|nr:hypothetical protein [Alphaproteobacteria bacterium]
MTLSLVSRRTLLVAAAALPFAPPALAQSGFPSTEAGARAVAAQFLATSGVDQAAAMKRLRPTQADYLAVYKEPVAGALEAENDRHWEKGETLRVGAQRTEILMIVVPTDDLIDGKPVLSEFPGGYRRVLPYLKRGIPIARFRYVEPGKTTGLAVDGLVHVNGRWVLMPKPWTVVKAE